MDVNSVCITIDRFDSLRKTEEAYFNKKVGFRSGYGEVGYLFLTIDEATQKLIDANNVLSEKLGEYTQSSFEVEKLKKELSSLKEQNEKLTSASIDNINVLTEKNKKIVDLYVEIETLKNKKWYNI